MSVQKKKDGRVFVVYSKDGRRVWEPFGRGRDAERAAKARDLELQLRRARGVPLPDTRISVTELFQLYLDNRAAELAESTMNVLCYVVAKDLVPEIGGKPAGAVTLQDWVRIQNRMLARNVSAATVNRLGAYANRFWKWAVQNGFLSQHPWINRVPLRNRKKFQIELFTLEEFRNVYACAAGHLAFALELLYYTGCRPGRELFGLKWGHVDWPRKRIRIFSPKTGAARWQWLPEPFLARAKERFQRQREKHPDCPWMIHFRGKPVDSLKRAWDDAKRAAGITRPLRLYDVRHFYISCALAEGAPIMDLAHRVGHATPDMIVRVYSHLVEDLRREEPLPIPEL